MRPGRPLLISALALVTALAACSSGGASGTNGSSKASTTTAAAREASPSAGCKDPAAKPTTIVAFHGTKDGIVPYAGGIIVDSLPA
jgi:poly(3-hydroxybutyrate) depolymerase